MAALSSKPFNLKGFVVANLGNLRNASRQFVPIILPTVAWQKPRDLEELLQTPGSPAPGPWTMLFYPPFISSLLGKHGSQIYHMKLNSGFPLTFLRSRL